MFFDETNKYFDILSNEAEYELENYIDKSKIYNTNINVDSINFRSVDLYNPMEGFNRGNMFEKEYSKYKNHVYKLKVNNKRDELLYNIQMHNFAMKDLNLYLDLHPEDTTMLKKYTEYNNSLNELKKKYNDKYGPLLACEVNNINKWTWINNPWPWDKGGNN